MKTLNKCARCGKTEKEGAVFNFSQGRNKKYPKKNCNKCRYLIYKEKHNVKTRPYSKRAVTIIIKPKMSKSEALEYYKRKFSEYFKINY